jgi:hypothetical protein
MGMMVITIIIIVITWAALAVSKGAVKEGGPSPVGLYGGRMAVLKAPSSGRAFAVRRAVVRGEAGHVDRLGVLGAA